MSFALSVRGLIALYGVIILAPLGLSALRVREARPILDEIASGAGMLAFSIILVDFTLSGRFRAISREVGMDITMRAHQLLARTALAAALLHPFLYRGERDTPYPWDTTRVLTVTTDFDLLWSGIVAWLLLPTLVLLALTRGEPNYRYEAWRWMHGIGALIVAGMALDHTRSAGRYAADPFVSGYWIALSGIAAFSVIWVYVLVPLRQLRRPWRMVSVDEEAERIWRVEVEPDGHAGLDYEAGQFAWLNLGTSPFRHRENPFSIASAPASGRNLSFLIKELGDTTSAIGAVRPGTVAYVDGPHGSLTLEGKDATGIGLVAGGIGIAPLIGLLRELSLTGDPRPRTLIYADKDPSQIVHQDELERLNEEPATSVVQVFDAPPDDWTGETGYVTEALLARHFPLEAWNDWLFVLCGPPPMLDAVENALISLGVSPERILSERFDYD